MKDLSIILGNQLFKPSFLKDLTNYPIFMCESDDLCTHFKYHQLKIIFFLTAMRNFNDELKAEGFDTFYHALPETKTQDYLSVLEEFCKKNHVETIHVIEIEDHFFADKIKNFSCQVIYEIIFHDKFS